MVRRISCFALLAVAVCGCDLFKEPKPKVAAQPVVKEQAPPQMEQVKADVGVGQKGSKIRGDGVNQMIAGPAIAYFNAKEKVVFQIQVPHALNLYWGEHGEYPKSHDEFMEKVIQFNMIQLPQLPEGARYLYDVESHTLMVERPAKSEAPAPSGG
jgi:hypothetical protein